MQRPFTFVVGVGVQVRDLWPQSVTILGLAPTQQGIGPGPRSLVRIGSRQYGTPIKKGNIASAICFSATTSEHERQVSKSACFAFVMKEI